MLSTNVIEAFMNKVDQFTAALSPDMQDRVITAEAARAHYAQSEGHHHYDAPQIVVQPTSIEDVQKAVKTAAMVGLPIIPYGAGTSLEGNAAAVHGGLCIDVSRMNRILDVRSDDLLCVIEPGVTREQLNTELRTSGLFFPVDPGANASLGGMISTRASGTTTVRYGSMRDNVLALKVVMPDGRLISTGTHARKSASGYDLTHMFAGSEGTLGIIVEASLRLHGQPDSILAATWDFETLEGAIQTVIATIQCGVPIARMEVLDPAAIRACNAFSKMDLPERPTLFLEFHGSANATAEQLDLVQAIGSDFGGGTFRRASATEDRNQLWKARHQMLPSCRALIPGAVVWTTDICVPISKLCDAITLVQDEVTKTGLTAPILGHVGDGNFHTLFVLPPNDTAAWENAKMINEKMINFALSVGGTCTGEHGIGIGKRTYMLREHGPDSIDIMRAIKAALDPKGIMNPGKIFLD
jgi:D-lactate dehydrogenase (cytochrome)